MSNIPAKSGTCVRSLDTRWAARNAISAWAVVSRRALT